MIGEWQIHMREICSATLKELKAINRGKSKENKKARAKEKENRRLQRVEQLTTMKLAYIATLDL